MANIRIGITAGLVMFAWSLLIPELASAENTIAQQITKILYNGSADYQYFVGVSDWGAPSCANAYYAQIPNSVPGRNKLLSIMLTAYAMGRKVQFEGSCNSNQNYFDVFYVIVSD